MTNDKLNQKSKINNPNKKYDLRDRIFKYVITVLRYLNKLPRNSINRIIIGQCARAVTSVGANYEEADVAHTKKDFAYKMEVVRKEAKETRYWLKVSREVNIKKFIQECEELRDEGLQLIRIFSTIISKSRK